MESGELGEALLELVGDEAQQVEGCIVDGAVGNCDGSSHALGRCVQLGEVDSLLADRLNLTGNSELHVVDAVRPHLVADDASQKTEIVGQLQACDLRVDEFVDGQGHST